MNYRDQIYKDCWGNLAMSDQSELPGVVEPKPISAGMHPLADLNAAKALAWAHAAAAVEVLAKIMVNTDLYDTEVRVQAAAELLQFAAKGPF